MAARSHLTKTDIVGGLHVRVATILFAPSLSDFGAHSNQAIRLFVYLTKQHKFNTL